ncbi:MAG TPA: hypothetical protein VHP83_14180 [Aggregatilineaceae bacterium]|nr:hypothetical protein [Aggregatilineaceae bacterium]
MLLVLDLNRGLARWGALGLMLALCRPTWKDLNSPEFYALPFQALGLISGFRLLHDPRRGWAYLFGLSAGLAVLCKQNTLGITTALLLISATAYRRIWNIRVLAVMLAGGLTAPGLFGLYFLARGSLDEALDAVLIYNRYYLEIHSSVLPWRVLGSAFRAETVQMLFMPLALFVVYAAVRSRPAAMFRTVLALAFLLDWYFASLSTRAYAHYYLTPLLTFATLVMLGLDALLKSHSLWVRRAAWSYLVLVLLLPTLLYDLLAFVAANGRLIAPARTTWMAEYVAAHTHEDDTVLNWGGGSDVNAWTHRRSPTRYHYTYPVTMPGYGSEKMVAELLRDLERHQPAYIVDMAVSIANEWVPPLDITTRQQWLQEHTYRGPDLEPIFQFVEKYCALEPIAPPESSSDEAVIFRCDYATILPPE